MRGICVKRAQGISIHPPRAGRDDDVKYAGCFTDISIHPPRAGRDILDSIVNGVTEEFQSTRPVRGGTRICDCRSTGGRISIHPPRAGRDKGKFYIPSDGVISIHPPRAGRDNDGLLTGKRAIHFNPPAPCGAGPAQACDTRNTVQFQSTRPVRGGTCAGSPFLSFDAISIHPPRAGRDPLAPRVLAVASHFNPPAPCGAGPGAGLL